MSYSATAPAFGDTASVMDRSWLTVAAAALGLMFSQGTLVLFTFGVFVRPLGAEFGWSRTRIALALSVSQWSFAVASPLWGYLIDRFGARRVLLCSVVGLSASVASFALLTSSLFHYYAMFFLAAVLGGCASPLGYSSILVRRFDRHLGLALGLALVGVGLGATVLPPLSQMLVADFGWREAYAVLGALTLLLTAPAALVATQGAGRPIPRSARTADIPIAPFLKSRTFVLLCVIFVLLGAIAVGAIASLVPMMIGHGFTPATAARMAGVTGLATIIGRGGIGGALDRFHAPYVVVAVTLLALAALLILAFTTGAVPSYTAAALLGLVVGAEVDFTAFFIRRYFTGLVFGRLYGIAFGVFVAGTGIGPVVMSTSFDRFGGYAPGLLLLSGTCVLVALLTLALPRYETEGAPAA